MSRVVSLSGRNKARVNGVELKVSELKLITEGLIEIVRQHESYRLLDEESHLGTLDEFARLTAEASLVEEAFDQLSALERERKGLEASRAERHERLRALEDDVLDHWSTSSIKRMAYSASALVARSRRAYRSA